MNTNFTAGFIGCGNMGGVLAAVAAQAIGGSRVFAADLDKAKTDTLSAERGCNVCDAKDAAEKCDFIVMGVKPQVLPAALEEIKPEIARRANDGQTVDADDASGCEPVGGVAKSIDDLSEDTPVIVTMAAGVKIAAIEKQLGAVPIIRIMPNIPCASGEGVILYCKNEKVSESKEKAFLEMFAPAGLLMPIEEEKIDAGCAISGCGPAFVYMFIDAMIDGGVRAGLPRETAKKLAEQTVLGAAKNALDTGEEPAKLKAEVCSPAGSTIEGVAVLEEMGLRSAVIEAVMAAYDRTVELGKS